MNYEDNFHDITADDLKNKTPALEQLLLEAAREAGAKTAVLFDGTEISLEDN